MDILIIIFVICLCFMAFINYKSQKEGENIKKYEKKFFERGLKLYKPYIVIKNNKKYIFQCYGFCNLGIQYYWTNLENGTVTKYYLSNIEELNQYDFIEYK